MTEDQVKFLTPFLEVTYGTEENAWKDYMDSVVHELTFKSSAGKFQHLPKPFPRQVTAAKEGESLFGGSDPVVKKVTGKNPRKLPVMPCLISFKEFYFI